MSALTSLKDDSIVIEYECIRSPSLSLPLFRKLNERPQGVTMIERILLSPPENTSPQSFYGYRHCHLLKLERLKEMVDNYIIDHLLISISAIQRCLEYAQVRLNEEKTPAARHILCTEIADDKTILKYLELLLAKKI